MDPTNHKRVLNAILRVFVKNGNFAVKIIYSHLDNKDLGYNSSVMF